jgi:hypothetical protein
MDTMLIKKGIFDLMALMVTLGSNFCFNLLNQLTNLRGAGKKPIAAEEENAKEPLNDPMPGVFDKHGVLSGFTVTGRKSSRIRKIAGFVGRPTPRAAPILLALLILVVGPGCLSWTTADGTLHTVIIGIGLVSQKEAPDHAATALRCQTLGLAVRAGPPSGGLVLGYQSLQQTAIAPEWQGVVRVSAGPGEPLTMTGLGDAPSSPMTFQPEEENNLCLPQPAKELVSSP